MNRIKIICLLLLLVSCLTLSGCRTRTTGGRQEERNGGKDTEGNAYVETSSSLHEDSTEEAEDTKRKNENEVSENRTKENSEAPRKEYDENAAAEILWGAESKVYGEGEGNGFYTVMEDAERIVDRLNDTAEEAATETVPAEQAEEKGVSENAEEADSAMTYFTVLLRDRMDSLFECQRQTVYWETVEDYVTIFKTSLEHELILNAGAYDVSARLLEENLHVDDGWIGRKNPGVIVKVVKSSILGTGVSAIGAAQKKRIELLARDGWAAIDAVRNGRILLLSEELLAAPHLQLVAMLMIAKTANPVLFSDFEGEKALEILAQETTGSIPLGIYWYNEQDGI